MKKQTKVRNQEKCPDDAALEEVFPNNPLKQVAFEVRFQRNLRVLRDIGEMQDELGPDFSFSGREEIRFPNEPPALSYGFVHRNGILTVKAGEDRLAVLVTRYEKFEDFVAEVINWTQRFCALFHVSKFKRIGLRYVNNIGIPKSGSSFLIDRYVNPYIDLERTGQERIREFSVELLTETQDCKFNTRSAFVTPPLSTEAMYILDLDAFSEAPSGIGQLKGTLDVLHYQAQIEFLAHVTESYKNIMRRKK